MTNREIYDKIARIFGPNHLGWGCPHCPHWAGFSHDLKAIDNYIAFDDFFQEKLACNACGEYDYVTRFWKLDSNLKTTLLIEIEKWFRNEGKITEPEMPEDVDKKLDSKRDDIFRHMCR